MGDVSLLKSCKEKLETSGYYLLKQLVMTQQRQIVFI